MRSKKIIAFLASFAMLFGTAGYMPAAYHVAAVETSVSSQLTAGKRVKLDEAPFKGFSSSNERHDEYFSEKDNGIYISMYEKLYFISAETGETSLVYTFDVKYDTYAVQPYFYNDKLYLLVKDSFDFSTNKYNYRVDVFDLTSKKLTSSIKLDYAAQSVGADDLGHIFIGTGSKIYMLDPNGKVLSDLDTESQMYRFAGYDSSNGNVYYEGYHNYIYWGYDHYMHAAMSGNVKNNALTLQSRYLVDLFQNSFYSHLDSLGIVGGKYLVMSGSNGTYILDSNAFDPTDEENNSLPLLFSKARTQLEDKASYDNLSFGIKTVYYPKDDSFILYMNGSELVEYDKSGAELSRAKTQGHVFSMFMSGDDVYAIELDDDGSYYLERITWKYSTYIKINAPKTTLAEGESIQLGYVTDGSLTEKLEWSVDDPTKASVTQDGKLYGTGSGKAVVTVTTSSGLKNSITVTVTPDSSTAAPNTETVSTGAKSTNASYGAYTIWSSTMNSYLSENADGTFERVELIDKSVVVEKYSKDLSKLISTKTITPPLSLFGGVYFGSDYNYIVYGSPNESESDDAEVLRIVRYTKSWVQDKTASVKGANTYMPFDAGSLRFTELDGKLYIHTAHKMYADDNGTRHQANMTYVLDTSAMEITDSYYDVSNLQSGYVSHSFNQFIQNDGEYVYRVDHAEGNNISFNGPISARGITISRVKKDSSLTNVDVSVPFYSMGSSNHPNYTGMTIGGFELSSDSCIIAHSEDIDNNYYKRNIFVTVTSKALEVENHVMLTSFDSSTSICAMTPQLVKIRDDLFMVLWEEQDRSASPYKYKVKAVMIDGQGNICSKTASLNARLSDCQPILCKDGTVRWYVTKNSAPVFYSISPFKLDEIKSSIPGDANSDGLVTVDDVLMIQQHIAGWSVAIDKTAANVNGDSDITIEDALLIQQHIAGWDVTLK